MADENAQQVEVKIDEAPVPDQQVKIEPAKPDDAIGDLKAQFAELEKKSEEDRKAREAAVTRENQARQELSRARAGEAAAREALTSSNLDTINTALASAEAELDAAEKEAARAGEAGDFVAQASANRRIGRASSQVERFSEAKSDLEARKTRPSRQPETPSDPVEAYVANRTPRTADWLRNHPDFVTNAQKNQRLTGAHYMAISEGHEPDTDDYFEFVEQQIGLRKGDGEVDVKPHTRQKPNSRPVAPVASNGGSGSNAASGRSNTVSLSASEAAAAVDGTHVWNYNDPSGQNKFKKGDPIGVQEFARRKQAMTARGDYDKTFTG